MKRVIPTILHSTSVRLFEEACFEGRIGYHSGYLRKSDFNIFRLIDKDLLCWLIEKYLIPLIEKELGST